MKPTPGSGKGPQAESCSSAPGLEPLEPRLLLNGVAPEFATMPTDQWFTGEEAVTIGIDGYDADGDALTITVESDNAGLSAFVPTGNRHARLHFVESDGVTPVGDIVVQVFETRGGEAAERFITLATNQVNPDGSLDPGGVPFYTDVVVHRVIPEFMIQTGDAENGDGTGDSPLGDLLDNFDPDLGFTNGGVLAMANSGPDTSNCQFFITQERSEWLNQHYLIFGHAISGYDVLDTIINLPRDPATNRPLDPPLLDYVEIFDGDQDATVTLQAVGGWAGQAQVTIRLDDGTNVTSETITVTSLGERPEVVDPGTLVAEPGQTTSFIVEVIDDGGMPMVIGGFSDVPGVLVEVDSGTGQVDLTVPPGFSGAVAVTLEPVEMGYGLEPGADTFYVVSMGPDDPPFVGRARGDGTTLHQDEAGDLLYLASMDAGLEAFDMADPANPVLLGTQPPPEPATEGEPTSARSVTVAGNTAFVSLTYAGLASVDVTDPAAMSILDVESVGSVAVAHILDGDIAYVASWQEGLVAFDISDPADLTIIGSLSDFGLPASDTRGVAMKDQYVYVSDMAGNFVAVVDVSDPTDMDMKGAAFMGGAPWGLAVHGDYLYVADQLAGLLVFNISRPNRPKFAGQLPLSNAWQVAVAGHMAVVGVAEGFAFVDVSDPERMSVEYIFDAQMLGGIPSFFGTQVALPGGVGGTFVLEAEELVNRVSVYKKWTLADDSGVPITISVRKGAVVAHTTGPGTGDIHTLEIIPDSTKATVKISAKNGVSTVGDVIVSGTVKSLTCKNVTLGGDLTIEGTISKLTLGDVDAEHTITIGPRPPGDTRTAVTMKAGRVAETSVISQTPFKSITVVEWIDQDATPDEVQAPSVKKLSTKGDRRGGLAGHFQADLDLDGSDNPKSTLGSAKIAGNLFEALWEIVGKMGKLTVKGSAIDSTVRASGDMAGIALGEAHGSDFLAGIFQAAGRRADGYGDFEHLSRIKSVKIKGQRAPGRFVTDSNFSAATIGSVSLVNAEVANGGTQFGVFARADGSGKEIKSVKYADKETGEKWKWSAKDSLFLTKQDLTLICHTDQPTVTYSTTDLGGGLYGLSFMVRGNDGLAASFFADISFEGVNGGQIVQQGVFLGGPEVEVDDETHADIFEGLGAPAYDKTRDSYFLEPFGSGDVQELNKGANFYQIKGGTGQGSDLEEADLAYIVTTGALHYYGYVARLGLSYLFDGIALI